MEKKPRARKASRKPALKSTKKPKPARLAARRVAKPRSSKPQTPKLNTRSSKTRNPKHKTTGRVTRVPVEPLPPSPLAALLGKPEDLRPRVLVFGNPLVEKDSIALKLMPELKKAFPDINFKEFDSAENLEDEGPDLTILDVAEGITRVVIITDLEELEARKVYSMHDFDLALTLRILLKIKAIISVRIIAIPVDHPIKKAFSEASEQIRVQVANRVR